MAPATASRPPRRRFAGALGQNGHGLAGFRQRTGLPLRSARGHGSRPLAIAGPVSPPHIYAMLQLTPILLALAYAAVVYWFSAARTRQELDAKSSDLTDPGLIGLTDRMARALDIDRIRVHIYEIDPVNGLAAPDGRIFITRGFYNRYRSGEVSGEELASVIAHELGHVALGHSRRRMIDFSGQNAVRVAMATVLNRVLPGVGPLIANGLMTLLAARMSRSDEYEADAYASALLIRAGIGTAPQKSLFDKLERLVGGAAGTPAWLMSHPRSVDRIRAIEANETRWLGNSGA